MTENKYPKVGVGVIVIRDQKVLMGKRKNAHGEGAWAFPGGHLEFGESWEACAQREVLEETGMEIANITLACPTNDIFLAEEKHYITIYMRAEWVSGEPQLLEPDKCEGWEWYEWDDLPSPLFLSDQNLFRSGYRP